MATATMWQTATATEILRLPFSISSPVTGRNSICPCLSLPLYNRPSFLPSPKLWEARCTPHSEGIPFLLEELPHEPGSCPDEINGKFTPNFSSCGTNLQAQCNRDGSEFKATLTSVPVLTSAIDLKRVSEDELSFFSLFFPPLLSFL